MRMGLILSIGESFSDLKKHGQDVLVRDHNLKAYSAVFEKVYVFSYANEKFPLFENCHLITNRFNLHRFFYSILMPIIRYKEFKDCDVLRGFQITGGIPCAVAKILFKKPFVVNYGYDYPAIAEIEGHPITAIFYRIISRIILPMADSVIVTNKTFVKYVKQVGAKNINVIPNSVNTRQFSPKPLKTKRAVTEILFVGRLESQKNILNMLQALKNIKHKYRLQIIGIGSQKKELQSYALQNSINAIFIDFIPHDELPRIMRNSDIFILPSIKEGNPKVLIEAMATGLACVATNVEGIREVIKNEKTGILIETEPKSIEAGIEKLFTNPKLAQKIGENARSYALSHFNASNLLKKEIKLLKSLVQ